MKRRAIALLMAAVTGTGLLAGCGSQPAATQEETSGQTQEAQSAQEAEQGTENEESGSEAETSAGDNGEKVTIQYYSWSEGDYLQEMVDAFNASSSNVTVEMTQVSSDEYDDKLMTMLAGSNDIDVFNMRSGSLLSNLATSGNLADITQRALEVLQAVDLIAAEDTRHTGLLLQHFGINARLFALHDHNEQQKAETLLAKLQEGQNIALVSDAGTPLINDPGYHLVRTCREAGIRVVPLPGPCAAITALSAAGLPSDRFCYEGFLPAKSKGRRDALKAIEAEPRTLIFYESTHRLLDSLEDIVAVLGESRYVVLARELTKTWETIHGAPVGELLAWVKEDENRRKGEMVLIVEGHKAQEEDLPADALRTLALLQAELPLKKAAALVAEIHGVKKNALYKYALEQQG